MKHPVLPVLLAAACAAPVSAAALAPQDVAQAAPQATADGTLPLTGLPADDPVVNAVWTTPDLQVMSHLDELVYGIGPRLTSSTNLTEACEWAVQRFTEWGLQDVRMEAWGEIPVGFDRYHLRGRVVQPRKIKLVFTTPAWAQPVITTSPCPGLLPVRRLRARTAAPRVGEPISWCPTGLRTAPPGMIGGGTATGSSTSSLLTSSMLTKPMAVHWVLN